MMHQDASFARLFVLCACAISLAMFVSALANAKQPKPPASYLLQVDRDLWTERAAPDLMNRYERDRALFRDWQARERAKRTAKTAAVAGASGSALFTAETPPTAECPFPGSQECRKLGPPVAGPPGLPIEPFPHGPRGPIGAPPVLRYEQ